jgi:hypothetical protein
MLFLERLAEEKIQQALARGDFDNLPGKGKPIPDEEGMAFIPEEMRVAYRLMKNAGYVPEEVWLLREIEDLTRLLELDEEESESQRAAQARLHLIIHRLGEMRGGNLALEDRYYRLIAERLGRTKPGRVEVL